MLKEKYANADPGEQDDLAAEFRTYSKEDLISVYGGLLEKFYTGAVRIEPMKRLVEDSIPVEQIESVLKDEIARRFLRMEPMIGNMTEQRMKTEIFSNNV